VLRPTTTLADQATTVRVDLVDMEASARQLTNTHDDPVVIVRGSAGQGGMEEEDLLLERTSMQDRRVGGVTDDLVATVASSNPRKMLPR
jgi:hypothetical protein